MTKNHRIKSLVPGWRLVANNSFPCTRFKFFERILNLQIHDEDEVLPHQESFMKFHQSFAFQFAGHHIIFTNGELQRVRIELDDFSSIFLSSGFAGCIFNDSELSSADFIPEVVIFLRIFGFDSVTFDGELLFLFTAFWREGVRFESF